MPVRVDFQQSVHFTFSTYNVWSMSNQEQQNTHTSRRKQQRRRKQRHRDQAFQSETKATTNPIRPPKTAPPKTPAYNPNDPGLSRRTTRCVQLAKLGQLATSTRWRAARAMFFRYARLLSGPWLNPFPSPACTNPPSITQSLVTNAGLLMRHLDRP